MSVLSELVSTESLRSVTRAGCMAMARASDRARLSNNEVMQTNLAGMEYLVWFANVSFNEFDAERLSGHCEGVRVCYIV